jgi:lipoprotein-anchoring transpeptidase ErfK/SrfK
MCGRMNHAAVRAVASAAALALLALAAVSSLGRAQSGRELPAWARAELAVRPRVDTIGERRDGRRVGSSDSARVLDAAAIAARVQSTADSIARSAPPIPTFRSHADSLTSVRTQLAADRDRDLRVVISLNDRRLWAIIGVDTLLKAPVAVSTDETLEYAGKTWQFLTPRGVRTVIDKRENPVWIPPEWHYAETAREHGLKLAVMKPGKTILSNGDWLEVRGKEVGVVAASTGEFAYLPTDEEVIFDNTLFVPPVGTLNRRIEGELGNHMLDTGNGFLLHGTPHKATIGTAATHGCIRLRDADIEWLYDMVPVGTRVYIY